MKYPLGTTFTNTDCAWKGTIIKIIDDEYTMHWDDNDDDDILELAEIDEFVDDYPDMIVTKPVLLPEELFTL